MQSQRAPSNNSPAAMWPGGPSVRRVWQAIYEHQRALGGDCDVAMKLLGIFKLAQMSTVEVRADAPFTNEDRRLGLYVDGAREIIRQTRQHLLDVA